jgi:predicted ATPase
VTSISPEAEKRLREVSHLSEEAYEKTAQQCILDSLSFNDMYRRLEAVDEAHYKTFKWIFEDAPKNVDDDSDCLLVGSFTHWFSSRKGIFYISGKMGSGKSTLMKFLCGHERTQAELRKWAGMSDALRIFRIKKVLTRHSQQGDRILRDAGNLHYSANLTSYYYRIPSCCPAGNCCSF